MNVTDTLWAIAVLVATAAFVASPLLAPGFGGFEPDQFPVPQIDPPVQPAGYAFAIWGVIYIWLALSSVFGMVARRDAPDWQAMRPYLVLSLAVGATWLPIATLSPLAATVTIWVMLVAALTAARRAPVLDRWWARAPIALYAGWLSAASAVSIGLVLGGWGLMDETSAAGIALVVAIALAFAMQVRLKFTPEYGGAVIWALVAVIVQNATAGSGLVIVVAGIGCLIVSYGILRALTD